MDAELLSGTFVDLADTMVADFDIIDFLEMLTGRSVQLLSASAAGVLLADPNGELRAVGPPVRPPDCSSCSRFRTTRAPAWTASTPAGPSRRLTSKGRISDGRGSRPPRSAPDSGPSWHCLCGSGMKSSAR
jgi:hypothetical protein